MSFLRADLDQLKAYVSHPGGATTQQVDILDTNESPYDLPTELKEKLADHYVNAIATNRYPDGSQHHLKTLIASYVQQSARLTASLGTQNVSVGNGSDELIRSILIATCLGGEGSILVADPTFSMYRILATTLGIPTITVNRHLSDFSMDLDAAQQAIAQTKRPPVRVVFVVHPNSPTGQCLTPAEIDWLRSLPEDILVVVDEAYYEFSQQTLLAEVLNRPNWLIMRTFSKAFRLAALRVGYAIAQPEVITALEKVRLPYNLPSFSQAAAILALEHKDYLLATVPEIQAEREKLFTQLRNVDKLKLWHSDANFIHARLQPIRQPQDEKLAQLVETLKTQGTLIRHTGGGLRISVGAVQENQRTLVRLTKSIELLS
ncbi:histidinol phosphate aminotransferase apoenzyme [[Leptolyngbya] sp. PCC 7376]|uniref:histidinol-phosphate transaminase n=1 Tax=[Leptolyngbya] sp. PCC 7376 TaxID=111781 RepID=UPI00029EE9B8|nr:histidinol-phosphate transaminase [[Leptolyngbya] sp. PCC 7376]AFY40404.1 histidinol phosphate aminotransferase apoenzyme [[Leptolyngbya] sp. PCC 7376]